MQAAADDQKSAGNLIHGQESPFCLVQDLPQPAGTCSLQLCEKDVPTWMEQNFIKAQPSPEKE